ncbi:MAG: hypothetical protein WCV70_02220 [Patescibacteria group bacterium]|jgi:hypothetical protein
MKDDENRKRLKKIEEILKRELGDIPEIRFTIRDDTKNPGQIIAELTVAALQAGMHELLDKTLGELFIYEKQVIDLENQLKTVEENKKADGQKFLDLLKRYDDLVVASEAMVKSKAELRSSAKTELDSILMRENKMETAIQKVIATCTGLNPSNKKADFIACLEKVKKILSDALSVI